MRDRAKKTLTEAHFTPGYVTWPYKNEIAARKQLLDDNAPPPEAPFSPLASRERFDCRVCHATRE